MIGESTWKPAADDSAPRDVLAMEVAGDPGPDGLNPVAAQVAIWVREAIAELSRKQKSVGERGISQEVTNAVSHATETAIGALEGKLQKARLEGAFKEAEILKLYAEIRVANATAAKIEAEEEQIRIANARTRLENALAAARAFGVDVQVLLGGERPPIIAAGDGLVVDDASQTTNMPADQQGETTEG